MENKFFTWGDFSNNFASHMVSAEDIYSSMAKGGLTKHSLLQFDFHFISNSKTNIESINEFLAKHYPYTLKPIYQREDQLWELTGVTNSFPATPDNFMYWILDMYKRGYEFDCELDGYGAPFDPEDQTFPDFSKDNEDFFFNQGVDKYNSGDLSGAIISWSNVLVINDQEVNSYYSRAIVKNELYTWKAALKDYDKALEISPDFISALLNRGSLKDENGDFKGAIQDYILVINNENSDEDDLQKAYFNKGNTFYNLKDTSSACLNWKKSAELGADYALERYNQYCGG